LKISTNLANDPIGDYINFTCWLLSLHMILIFAQKSIIRVLQVRATQMHALDLVFVSLNSWKMQQNTIIPFSGIRNARAQIFCKCIQLTSFKENNHNNPLVYSTAANFITRTIYMHTVVSDLKRSAN
jgi:hypothetical protein